MFSRSFSLGSSTSITLAAALRLARSCWNSSLLISGCGAAVGDMTQDCVYESDDVDAFIEALRDVDGYNSSHSFPRHQVGDLTADFEMNFADIPGFVAKMNEEGVAVTVPSLIAAINGVPEPNLGMFFLVVSVAMLIGTRRCRDRA